MKRLVALGIAAFRLDPSMDLRDLDDTVGYQEIARPRWVTTTRNPMIDIPRTSTGNKLWNLTNVCRL